MACEPVGKIKVKGIAYPVQTYQVLDPHEKLTKEKTRLMEEFEGFALSIDFSALTETDKIQALALLEKAITKIRENKHT